MSPHKPVLASLLLAAFSLIGCASDRPPPVVIKEMVRVQPNVPAALTACPDEPRAPAPDADEVTFWAWAAETIDAGEACRQVVKGRARFDAAGGAP